MGLFVWRVVEKSSPEYDILHLAWRTRKPALGYFVTEFRELDDERAVFRFTETSDSRDAEGLPGTVSDEEGKPVEE